uniref:flavin-containing monooxygenase n=1 Tax=Rhodococcus qingshengii TaxID=334542 RepID=UPI00211A0678|nr:NAD(P)/FAD-dependent oxidoreductase [Rhodococcus qingshengii]
MSVSMVQSERVDVVLVGAGISGIGIGRQLRVSHPDKSLVILEARESVGGTWDLFRYPGIRSDSDLYTFGYSFKPWRDKDAIADAPKILHYLKETVTEAGLDEVIRFGHRVVHADWSSRSALWTLDVESTDSETGETRRAQIQTRWYINATGYYRYDQGYSPAFEGEGEFAGDILHAQHWPEGYDYAGKRVVVIGSGATAFTLVPAMTSGDGSAAHVTQLQRTPTYVSSAPRRDAVAGLLTKALGEDRAFSIIRKKNESLSRVFITAFKRYPTLAKRFLISQVRKNLPQGFDVDTHFTPPYNPWDQRIALVPDGDYFEALKAGRASVETGRITRITTSGIVLESGRELPADLIVKATGLNLRLFGGTTMSVDGAAVHLPDTLAYRGMMLSGVPNMVMVIGYVLSTWTLKIDLIWEQLDKLIRHLDSNGFGSVMPIADPTVKTRPLLDFGAGYVQRSVDELPRRGLTAPWLMVGTSWEDEALLKSSSVFDPALRYTVDPSLSATPTSDRRPTTRRKANA